MFESIAYAAPAAAGAPQQVNPIMSFFPIILIFVIFYFLLIRPQQKRQQELSKLVDNLKKGDRVITAGGLIGTVNSIQNDYLVMSVGNSETKIEVLKSSVTGLRDKIESKK